MVWPYTSCPACNGSGKSRSPSGKAWRPCRRCAEARAAVCESAGGSLAQEPTDRGSSYPGVDHFAEERPRVAPGGTRRGLTPRRRQVSVMDDRTDLGGRIRQLRSQVSMSQRELAERASVSTSFESSSRDFGRPRVSAACRASPGRSMWISRSC
jgi:hypothetical protein